MSAVVRFEAGLWRTYGLQNSPVLDGEVANRSSVELHYAAACLPVGGVHTGIGVYCSVECKVLEGL